MKREFSRLPASELRIMQALWQGHPQMSRQEIQEIVNRQRRLAPIHTDRRRVSLPEAGDAHRQRTLLKHRARDRIQPGAAIRSLE